MSWYDNVFLMQGYDDSDSDDSNPIILEKCIVAAEEEAGWIFSFPDDFEFEAFKDGLKKFYDAFIEAYTEKHYWKLHAEHYDYVLW